jgi:hypothetical protein
VKKLLEFRCISVPDWAVWVKFGELENHFLSAKAPENPKKSPASTPG